MNGLGHILKTTVLGGCLLLLSQAESPAAYVVEEDVIREKVLAHVQAQLETIAPDLVSAPAPSKEDESKKNPVQQKDTAKLNIEIIKVPAAPFAFPEADSAEDVEISTESPLSEFYSERAIVRVKMMGPAGRSREIGVPIKLSIKKPVWVVKNPVDAHQPLKASDFSLETREVSRVFAHTVGIEQALKQYVARVNLKPGELLDNRKIIVPPDVKRNAEIKIVMSNGQGMSVTLPGIAMMDGRIGETIKVRQLLYQRKYYTARIIDKNRVLIEI